jgi:phage FluMu protein Com
MTMLHVKKRESARMKCPDCQYTTIYTGLLARHIELHEKRKCPHCKYSAKQCSGYKRRLVLHIREVHELKNKCPHCPFINIHAGQLSRHMTMVHSNKRRDEIRDKKCPLCPYTTGFGSGLNRHVKTVHHKIKDHKCTHCNFAASYKSRLRLHVTSVHKDKSAARIAPTPAVGIISSNAT